MERQRQFKEVLKEIKFTDAESYGCETNCHLNLLRHMNALCQLWKMMQIQPRAVRLPRRHLLLMNNIITYSLGKNKALQNNIFEHRLKPVKEPLSQLCVKCPCL